MNRRMRDYMDRRMMNDRGRGDMYDRGGEDMRDMRGDGRNPYGSRGGYVTSRRPRGRDRGYEDGGYYEGNFRGTTRDYAGRDYDDYNDYGDYAAEHVLSPAEIKEWKRDLMANVNDSSKMMLADENIMKKAKSMGIKFDKYTEDELILTTIMMFTDHWKTGGKGNVDMYIKLADDWLCDEDTAVCGGEKLATYYDAIVVGE